MDAFRLGDTDDVSVQDSHGVVESEVLASRELLVLLADEVESIGEAVAVLDERRRHNGARVDHRIVRFVCTTKTNQNDHNMPQLLRHNS